MLDTFLYVGFPYLALAVLVVGTFMRWLRAPYGISALSSQVLEDRALGFGSMLFHIGILLILAGHLAAFLLPTLWRSLLVVPGALIAVEVVGFAAAVAAAVGLSVLLARRIFVGRLQAVTTPMDLLVVGLLLATVVLGAAVAIRHRWGSAWATGTVVPYVWSLLTLRPNPALVTELPPLLKAHIVLASTLALVTPFSRLVHLFFLPAAYVLRPPQLVVWTSVRRRELMDRIPGGDPEIGRRNLVTGMVGVGVATTLLGAGVAEKLFRFFQKQNLTPETKRRLLVERQSRVESTASERALELERLTNDFIFVARYDELSPKSGKYFIDYEMRPALAFLGGDRMPNLLSAKCTHLGCTVGRDVDDQGRILCPCHISYFDIRTGAPHAGAPAKDPLPHIAWSLHDATGAVLASADATGLVQGEQRPEKLAQCSLFIVKPREQTI